MKPIILLLIVAIVFVGLVVAQSLMTTNFTSSTTMDKVSRDYLLTKIPTVMDKGQPLPKEIKPTINIVCSAKECKYSAVQDGLIASYDNIINREYCSEYFKDSSNCSKISIYTITEIQQQVSEIVTKRLEDYANKSISEDTKVATEVSTGTITIGEKR